MYKNQIKKIYLIEGIVQVVTSVIKSCNRVIYYFNVCPCICHRCCGIWIYFGAASASSPVTLALDRRAFFAP